jgi:hypothetical protein
MFAAGRQIWLGKPFAGQQVTLRIAHTSLHVFHAGELLVQTGLFCTSWCFRRSRCDVSTAREFTRR